MYGSLFQGDGDVKERRPKKVGQGKKRIDKPELVNLALGKFPERKLLLR